MTAGMPFEGAVPACMPLFVCSASLAPALPTPPLPLGTGSPQVTALVTRDAGPGGAGGAAGAGTERAGGQLTAALGTLWAHAVNTRLVLESVRGERQGVMLCALLRTVQPIAASRCPAVNAGHASDIWLLL